MGSRPGTRPQPLPEPRDTVRTTMGTEADPRQKRFRVGLGFRVGRWKETKEWWILGRKGSGFRKALEYLVSGKQRNGGS